MTKFGSQVLQLKSSIKNQKVTPDLTDKAVHGMPVSLYLLFIGKRKQLPKLQILPVLQLLAVQ